MKTLKIVAFSLLVILSANLSAQEQQQDNRNLRKERVASAIRAFIDSGNIEIIIDKVIPKSRQIITVNREYYLIIRKDSLICYLPYIGKSDSPSVAPTSERFEFKEEKISVTKCEPRPGIHLLKFNTKADIGIETFSFTITIFESGFCTINLAPSSRDYIIYQGTIKF